MKNFDRHVIQFDLQRNDTIEIFAASTVLDSEKRLKKKTPDPLTMQLFFFRQTQQRGRGQEDTRRVPERCRRNRN